MMWLYVATAITLIVQAMAYTALKGHWTRTLDPNIVKRLSREQQEDKAIDELEQRFVADEITMEELAAGTEAILTGKALPDPSNHEGRGFLTSAQATLMPPPGRITGRGVAPERIPAGELVRSYSYPAAPGWPETDPPHPGYVCGTCHKSVDRLVPTKGICHNCDKAFSKAQQQWGYNPPKMSSDGHTLCTKDAGGYPRTSVCGCPDCMGTEEFYEALEQMNEYDYRKKEFVA